MCMRPHPPALICPQRPGPLPPSHLPASAEKAKLETFFKGLADELVGTGVTAQALALGPVVTPGTNKYMVRGGGVAVRVWLVGFRG